MPETGCLLGVHDRQGILNALCRMVGSIYMDVHPAGGIHPPAVPSKTPHHLLQFFHLAVFKFGTHHLGTVLQRCLTRPPISPDLRSNTAVISKFPDFPFLIPCLR